ncbi:MAG: DUF4140 domain-containing protein, partial [Prevotellaceae bacterium]|nr:DUF4140 domain-containing protein [Prevotellaceae bacterium]
MKKISLLIAIVLSANAAADNVKTSLESATVFFKGAELAHTVAVQLKAGENALTLEGLSPMIDINSLKINVTNSVVVASSEFSTDFLTEKKETDLVKKLQDSITVCNEDMSKLSIAIRVNKNALSIMREGINSNMKVENKPISVSEIAQMTDYYINKA